MTVGSRTVDARVGIVHERFTELGGSEAVVEHLAALSREAEVFVPIADPAVRPGRLAGVPVRTSWLQHLYAGGESYAHLLPLLPLAMRTADLSGFDVVVTSHHAFANRVRPPEGVPVVSYTHTPARWMWRADMRAGEAGPAGRAVLGAFAATQRRADRLAAARAHTVVANSHAVADRVREWWGREAVVVAPPVEVERFTPGTGPREPFFLLAGRLVPYKQPQVAVEAARRAGVRLVVAGDGRARAECERLAGPGTTFLGRVSDAELRELFRTCRALVFPGVEDFGIVPVEAQACGAPVVALGAGGALDTVRPGETGVLVDPADDPVEGFAAALAGFTPLDPAAARRNAERFSVDAFRERMTAVVEGALARSSV